MLPSQKASLRIRVVPDEARDNSAVVPDETAMGIGFPAIWGGDSASSGLPGRAGFSEDSKASSELWDFP